MGSKRARKKKLQQDRRLRDRAEELFLRGDDDAFLDLVAQVEDLDQAGLAGAYREVVERTLWRHLGNADVAALEKLLNRPRAGVERLAGVCLAAAVVDVDAGRLEAASVRLESLETAAGDGRPVPPDLLRRMQALCDTALGAAASKAAAEERCAPLADYRKLCRTLGRYASGELGKLPGNLRLTRPYARDVLDFVRALEAVGRAPRSARSAAKTLDRLRHTARTLLDGKPSEASEVLALGALRFARWLAVADQLETRLNRHGADLDDVEGVLVRLRQDRGKLSELFDERMPAALHGLRHLLEKRCRALLGRLVELAGSTVLARVRAAVGGAFDSMLEVAGPAGEESRQRIEKWATCRSLLDQWSFPALARFCSGESAAVDEPCRLAMLWGVELGALWQAAEVAAEDDYGAFADTDDEPESRAWRRILTRLWTMSGQLERRLPTAEQRVQVARVLRRQLLDLADSSELNEHFLATAESLLRYLGDDAALLLGALAAATEIRDRAAAHRLAERIAARGPARQAELEMLMPFLSPAAGAEPAEIATFVRHSRPLFGEAWPHARSVAAQVVEMRVLFLLGMLLEAGGSEFRELAEGGRQEIRAELEDFRPLFGEERGFQVADWLAEAAFEDASRMRSSLRKLLRRYTDPEAALAALRALDSLAALSDAFEPARAVAIEAMLTRLDHRWPLWQQSFEAILPTLERKQLLLGHNRLTKILSDDALEDADRQVLEDMRSLVEVRLDMDRSRARRQTTRSKRGSGRPRGRRPRPPRTPSSDGQLELFGNPEESLP